MSHETVVSEDHHRVHMAAGAVGQLDARATKAEPTLQIAAEPAQ